jgi:copper chaperone CopZ
MEKQDFHPFFKIGVVACLILIGNSFGKDASNSITVSVKGMVCDFCAQGLKKSFLKKEPVDSIQVSLEKGLVVLYPKEGQSISDEVIQQRIRDNGISVESIQYSSNDKGKE